MRIDPSKVKDQPTILADAHALLRDRYGFFFVTLQIETECLDERAARPVDILQA